jgi:hypothetical protein
VVPNRLENQVLSRNERLHEATGSTAGMNRKNELLEGERYESSEVSGVAFGGQGERRTPDAVLTLSRPTVMRYIQRASTRELGDTGLRGWLQGRRPLEPDRVMPA